MEDVERGIWEVAMMVDTGMEVDEMDLCDFLGEPQPEGMQGYAVDLLVGI